jgi:hypothetical protein
MADTFLTNGVPIVDVGTPASPLLRAFVDFSSFRGGDGAGIAVDDTFVYLTSTQGGSTENQAGTRWTASSSGAPGVRAKVDLHRRGRPVATHRGALRQGAVEELARGASRLAHPTPMGRARA